MSSNDPYGKLPNLAGEAGRIEDIRSSGDPSRFFPSARGGYTDAVSGRILDSPRCKIYRNAALTLVAATQTLVVYDTVEYDTDNMANPQGGARITCRSPGLYITNAAIEFNAALNDNLWCRLIANGGTLVASVTGPGQGFGFGSHFQPTGFWNARAGDYLELYIYDNPTAAGIFTGIGQLFMQVCRISTIGSDQQ